MKLPRDISGVRLAKAFQRLGWIVVRQEGSHLRLSKGTLRVTIPNHSPIHPKTLSTIIRQSGSSQEEILQAIR